MKRPEGAGRLYRGEWSLEDLAAMLIYNRWWHRR